MRSLITIPLRLIGWLAIALCALAIITWLFAQIVSDRIHILQFIAWAPSWLILSPAGVLLLVSLLARAREQGAPRRTKAIFATRMLMLALGLCSLHVHLYELHWINALCPSSTPNAKSIRIAHWNLDAHDAQTYAGDLETSLPRPTPDIVFFSSNQRTKLYKGFTAAITKTHTLQRSGTFSIFSKFPITSFRRLSLNLYKEPNELDPTGQAERAIRARLEDFWNRNCQRFGISLRTFSEAESGDLMILQLDTTKALGRAITVYYIDLPSDPFASRWSNALQIRTRLDRLIAGTDAQSPGRPIPAPDILLGDFNTPRGSASLSIIARNMTHAFDQAGFGHAVSFPRTYPLLHIDHLFLAPGLHASHYETFVPPAGDHWAQFADIYATPR